jgi:hypothetical protein
MSSNTTSTTFSHCSRAFDLFSSNSVYFGIGYQSPWADENNPPQVNYNDLEIYQIIGYKKVEDLYMVVPDEYGSVIYRDSQWRVISPVRYRFQLIAEVNQGDTQVIVQSSDPNKLAAVTTGTKVMLQNRQAAGHYAKITNIDGSGTQLTLTLDTAADITYPAGSWVHWGIIAESCRSCLIGTWIRYDELPLYPYRVIGVFNRLELAEGIPSTTLALYPNQVEDPGFLECVQYRRAFSRNIDQREYLSVIVEF